MGTRGGFLLLECMLAVFIFSIAALGLGRCVQNCLKAEKFRREEALAQRALANYWAQIELGTIPLSADKASIDLEGAWKGMKLAVLREPLQLMNEKDQELFGIYQVRMALSWQQAGELQVRNMDFLLYPRTR